MQTYYSNPLLIWFNGTGEKEEDTQHLFKGVREEDKYIFPGWGTDRFGLLKQVTGVGETNTFEKSLLCKKNKVGHQLWDDIKCRDSLVIGGFSRGAAFFIPYFTKLLSERVKSQHLNKFRKIAFIILDPVTGSATPEETTEKTLQAAQLYDVSHIRDGMLSAAEKNIVVVILSAYETRQKNFSQYDRLLKALIPENILQSRYNVFTTLQKAGISHSSLTLWSTEVAPQVKNSMQIKVQHPILMRLRKGEEVMLMLDDYLKGQGSWFYVKDILLRAYNLNTEGAQFYKTNQWEAFTEFKSKIEAMLGYQVDMRITKRLVESLMYRQEFNATELDEMRVYFDCLDWFTQNVEEVCFPTDIIRVLTELFQGSEQRIACMKSTKYKRSGSIGDVVAKWYS